MAETRVYFARTRKGKIGCVVREKYCAESLGFGYLHRKEVNSEQLNSLLSNTVHNTIFFLDTNIVLHHIDLLESKPNLTEVVVIPHTTLKELRNLNYSVYKRMMTIMNDEQRCFIFLPNENHDQIESERHLGETVNDAHDRFIVNSAVFYNSMLSSQGRNVVLVTNDEGNLARARSAGIKSINMRAYVSTYGDSSMSLTDFGQPKDLTASGSLLFPPHLSNEELRSGMKAGRYFRGVIRVKGNDRNECYVILMNFSGKDRKTVTVRGENHVNRAVDGDIVAVELLPDTPAEKERNTEYLEEEGIEEDAVAPLLGRVVGIIQHTSEQYAGSIDPGSLQSVSSHSAGEDDTEYYTARFIPMNKRIPPIMVSSRRLPSLLAYRLLAVIDEWPASSVLPFGHCLKVLGAKGDKEVETKLILFEFGVPNEEFTAEVMACLPEKGWTIPQEEIDKRLDCRALPIASVDPPGCKDIDDALHCMALPNGHFQVGVHIADVSHFVLPDTPLDLEASHRSTSTYLVERRLDMLPSLLTTQLCSLRGQEDHLAFSVFWELDADGQIFDVSFHKTVIRSVASLTYDQAQTILDDKQAPDDPVLNQPALVQSIKMLNQFARLLRKRRLENGALTLVSPEVRFKLDEETKDPTDVIMYNLKEAHAMVEEWMLLANITVAKKTLLHFPTLSILRRHQSPSLEQLQPLIQAARHAGFQLEVTNSKALADSLDRAVKADDAYFNSLLRILATRCMMPAQYFCSGEIPKDAWYHYGLATPVYTHFTSPIRRYADVLVHRLLAAAIGVAPLPLANTDRGKQREVCAHMNRRHRLAQYAQRSSVALHTTIFFAQRSVTEDAYVIAIREEECDVLVPKFGIEESLPYSSVAAGFSADLQSYAVRFPGGRSLTIFQRIRVTISVREETNEKKLVLALAQ